MESSCGKDTDQIWYSEHEAVRTELISKNGDLRTEYEAHLQECNECKGELLQQIRDLQGLSQRYNFKVSDEELMEQWGTIKHKISQMVDKYARPVYGLNDQDLGPGWIGMSRHTAFLLGSPLLYAFAFEAYLWSWLGWVVFRDDSVIWAGNLGRYLSYVFQDASGKFLFALLVGVR